MDDCVELLLVWLVCNLMLDCYWIVIELIIVPTQLLMWLLDSIDLLDKDTWDNGHPHQFLKQQFTRIR